MTKLEELRGKKSQRQVAKELRISAAYYNYIETGEHLPSLTVAYKIAAYYGVTVIDLFHLKDGNVWLTESGR